jgi:exopolyphosphatase
MRYIATSKTTAADVSTASKSMPALPGSDIVVDPAYEPYLFNFIQYLARNRGLLDFLDVDFQQIDLEKLLHSILFTRTAERDLLEQLRSLGPVKRKYVADLENALEEFRYKGELVRSAFTKIIEHVQANISERLSNASISDYIRSALFGFQSNKPVSPELRNLYNDLLYELSLFFETGTEFSTTTKTSIRTLKNFAFGDFIQRRLAVLNDIPTAIPCSPSPVSDRFRSWITRWTKLSPPVSLSLKTARPDALNNISGTNVQLARGISGLEFNADFSHLEPGRYRFTLTRTDSEGAVSYSQCDLVKRNRNTRVVLGPLSAKTGDTIRFHLSELDHNGSPERLVYRSNSLRFSEFHPRHRTLVSLLESLVSLIRHLAVRLIESLDPGIVPHRIEEADVRWTTRGALPNKTEYRPRRSGIYMPYVAHSNFAPLYETRVYTMDGTGQVTVPTREYLGPVVTDLRERLPVEKQRELLRGFEEGKTAPSVLLVVPTYTHDIMSIMPLLEQEYARFRKEGIKVTIAIAVNGKDSEKRTGVVNELIKLQNKIREQGKDFEFQVMNIPLQGKINSLNTAAEYGRRIGANIMNIIDDDIDFHEGTLVEGIKSFLSEKRICISGAKIVPFESDTWWGRMANIIKNKNGFNHINGCHNVQYLDAYPMIPSFISSDDIFLTSYYALAPDESGGVYDRVHINHDLTVRAGFPASLITDVRRRLRFGFEDGIYKDIFRYKYKAVDDHLDSRISNNLRNAFRNFLHSREDRDYIIAFFLRHAMKKNVRRLINLNLLVRSWLNRPKGKQKKLPWNAAAETKRKWNVQDEAARSVLFNLQESTYRGKKMLERFLKGDFQTDGEYRSIHLVMGNTAMDLDSAISSITYAHAKNVAETNKTVKTLFVPFMNMKREDFKLRPDVSAWLDRFGITENDLLFADDLDYSRAVSGMPSLETPMLQVSLMDHNHLAPDQSFLAPYVAAVIDHHDDRESWRQYGGALETPCDARIEPVGSNMSLVAGSVMETAENHPEMLTPELARLMAGVIIRDTYYTAEGIKNPVDENMIKTLLDVAGESDEFARSTHAFLTSALQDTSAWSTFDFLRSDYKLYSAARGKKRSDFVVASTLSMDENEMLKRESEQSVEDFFRLLHNRNGYESRDRTLFCMTINKRGDSIERGLVFHSLDPSLHARLMRFLNENGHMEGPDARPEGLHLKPISAAEGNPHTSAFEMSLNINRKKLVPVLEDFFQDELERPETEFVDREISEGISRTVNEEMLDVLAGYNIDVNTPFYYQYRVGEDQRPGLLEEARSGRGHYCLGLSRILQENIRNAVLSGRLTDSLSHLGEVSVEEVSKDDGESGYRFRIRTGEREYFMDVFIIRALAQFPGWSPSTSHFVKFLHHSCMTRITDEHGRVVNRILNDSGLEIRKSIDVDGSAHDVRGKKVHSLHSFKELDRNDPEGGYRELHAFIDANPELAWLKNTEEGLDVFEHLKENGTLLYINGVPRYVFLEEPVSRKTFNRYNSDVVDRTTFEKQYIFKANEQGINEAKIKIQIRPDDAGKIMVAAYYLGSNGVRSDEISFFADELETLLAKDFLTDPAVSPEERSRLIRDLEILVRAGERLGIAPSLPEYPVPEEFVEAFRRSNLFDRLKTVFDRRSDFLANLREQRERAEREYSESVARSRERKAREILPESHIEALEKFGIPLSRIDDVARQKGSGKATYFFNDGGVDFILKKERVPRTTVELMVDMSSRMRKHRIAFPLFVETPEGEKIIEIDGELFTLQRAFSNEVIGLKTPSSDTLKNVAAEIARYQVRTDEAISEEDMEPREGEPVSSLDRFQEIRHNLVLHLDRAQESTGENVLLRSGRIRSLRNALRYIDSYLPSPQFEKFPNSFFSHSDLTRFNVMTNEQGEVTGIIDLETCRVASTRWDDLLSLLFHDITATGEEEFDFDRFAIWLSHYNRMIAPEYGLTPLEKSPEVLKSLLLMMYLKTIQMNLDHLEEWGDAPKVIENSIRNLNHVLATPEGTFEDLSTCLKKRESWDDFNRPPKLDMIKAVYHHAPKAFSSDGKLDDIPVDENAITVSLDFSVGRLLHGRTGISADDLLLTFNPKRSFSTLHALRTLNASLGRLSDYLRARDGTFSPGQQTGVLEELFDNILSERTPPAVMPYQVKRAAARASELIHSAS